MHYIAILDYRNLDHPLFMKSFAEAMGRQQGCNGIILHGDSPYTERLKKSGLDHDHAIIRSTKDLNHRIVALLADNGVPVIGINGYQKDIIRLDKESLTVEKKWIEDRPAGTHLVISNLLCKPDSGSIIPFPLNKLAGQLSVILNRKYILLFPSDDNIAQTEIDHASRNPLKYIADEIKPLPENSYLCSTIGFGKLPKIAGLLKLFA